jgi:hypothetical protein
MRFLLNYIYGDMIAEDMNVMPLSVKMSVLAPHLIQTCALMATNERLEIFVADEVYSELLVSLLDILIIISGQQAFQDVFI